MHNDEREPRKKRAREEYDFRGKDKGVMESMGSQKYKNTQYRK